MAPTLDGNWKTSKKKKNPTFEEKERKSTQAKVSRVPDLPEKAENAGSLALSRKEIIRGGGGEIS